MKLPFKRNKAKADQLPVEIRNYYQSETRERMGVAWLLAAGVFIVTLLLAAGLFFGGKWAFNKITGDDKPAVTQDQPAPATDQPTGATPPEAPAAPTPSAPAPTPAPTSPAVAPVPAGLPNTNGDE